MATYYPNSSNQGDVLPATYLREPKLASHPDLVPGYMMMYLNQASSAGAYSEFPIKGMAGDSLSPQNSVGIQSVGGENEFVYIPSTNDAISVQSISGHSNPANTNSSSAIGGPITAPSTQLGSLDGGQNSQHQGLSLSLCTQITSADPMLSAYCHYSSPGMSMTSLLTNHVPMSVDGTSFKDYESSQSKNLEYVEYVSYDFPRENHDAVKNKAFYSPQCSVNPIRIHSDPLLHESSVLENTICNSRYLKAAQQLLDEIVNVQMALKKPENYQNINGNDLDASTEIDGRSGGLFPKNEMSSVQNDAAASGELSLVEQQDLQNKKIKLMSLVDEVDRRYKQYYHQMKLVISSLDSIAGFGAAKTYTELARITISRHFRCLRDAITGQIEVTQRSLGEQDNSPGIPRLCHVDQHFRKQRAIQQLGVLRHAWRPQRGLPETSVSILRAWLFEHFLHPYPKDSEKIMLARQTGLTRSQVANWFINARVRLWKPMVEEMYKEEFDDFDVNSKSHPENASIEPKDSSSLKCKDRAVELQESLTSTAAGSSYAGHSSESKSDFIPDAERNGHTLRGGSQNCAPHQDDNLYFGVMTPVNGKRLNVDVCSLYPDEFISADQSATGSNLAAAAADDATYSVSGRADSQVSLALGLRHHEANVLTM